MEFKDYYSILGIDPIADDKAIKTAYRKLARQYHPDVSKQADAEEKFKEVSEAYEVLHNNEKRAEYDQLRLARNRNFGTQHQRTYSSEQDFDEFTAQGEFGHDADFADFFSSIFGSQNSGNGFNQSFYEDSRPNLDLEMELPVMLEDTLIDKTRNIEFTIPGVDDRGQKRNIKKSINVKIPAGVNDGERIRLKGQGIPSSGSGANGDLYLHIRLIPHPLFDVEANHLIITVPLAPWEAALGTKIVLPTLDGKINLTIPPNSQTGKRLRIPGKGLIGRQGKGDLFASLKIIVPQTTSEDIHQLWTELANKARFDPRAEWSSKS